MVPFTTMCREPIVAQKIQVILTDDIDGEAADETIQFAIDGVTYEIDLCTDNAHALLEALRAYTHAARKLGGKARTTPMNTAAPRQRPDLSAVRAWARDNGHTVSDRGRLSKEIQAAYEAAQVPAST